MATVTFPQSGGNTSFTVPYSVTSITIDCYGQKGADASDGAGGNGAHTTGTLAVSGGQVYGVIFQGAGGGGSGSNSGAAGGVMAWFGSSSSYLQANSVLVAGGGGGGGGNAGGVFHGGGGGVGGNTSGTDGGVGSSGPNGGVGGGGTTSAGGAGGSAPAGAGVGTAGSDGQGGTGGHSNNSFGASGGGGGGGGGYFGGGGAGGGGSGGAQGTSSGGGGGASFFSGSLTATSGTAGANATTAQIVITYTDPTVLGVGPSWAPVFESDSATESLTVNPLLLSPSISDQETVTENISFAVINYAQAALNCSAVVSNYKWLTTTLYNKQSSYTVQPYVKCQIIDQSNIFNQQLTNNGQQGGGFQTVSGSQCIAPDGAILAVGKDVNGNLAFFKITDATQISQWNKIYNTGGTTVVANGNWAPHNTNVDTTGHTFHLNASISCSDFIGSASGKYIIDVYYFVNTGGNFEPVLSRSLDGGATWTSYSPTTYGIPNTTKNFFGLSAGKPIYVPATGNTSATVFICTGLNNGANDNTMAYQYSAGGHYLDGGLAWNFFHLSALSEPTGDLTFHSLDVQWVNGTYYVVFSGYHQWLENTNTGPATGTSLVASSVQNQFFGNYSLYLTRVLQITDAGTGVQTGTSSIWDEPREILAFNSNATTNLNQCLYPSLRYDGTYLWLTFRGDLTSSVSETGASTQTINYYLSKSADFTNFDYPLTIVDSSGNSVKDPNGLGSLTNGLCKYCFVGNQTNFYYLFGDGALWQFIQNSVAADVSGDVISCEISDQTGGASSINLTIANGSGKWFGPSPTGTGFAAICKSGKANKNSQIFLQLGYVTSAGSESVPRNVYYITDITQNVTATQNDLVIVGQDFNLLLQTTQTRFSYTFQGPDLYNDQFLNTTITNWTTSLGTWIQASPSLTVNGVVNNFNAFTPWTTYQPAATSGGAASPGNWVLNTQTLAVLSGYPIHRPNIGLSCSFYLPSTATSGSAEYDFYPFFRDINNYILIKVTYTSGTNSLITVVQVYNGSTITLTNPSSAAFALTLGQWYSIYINMYGFANRVDVGLSSVGNSSFNIFGFQNLIGSASVQMGQNQYQAIAGIVSNTLPTVAIGTNGAFVSSLGAVNTAPLSAAFANLKFVQSTYSQTIGELVQKIGTKAHIFNYNFEQDLVQDLYDTTQWFKTSGSTFTLTNREINLTNNNAILQKNNQYADGQIEFDAKVAVSALDNFGFDFILRNKNTIDLTNCYKIRFMSSFNRGSVSQIVKVSTLISTNTAGPTYVDYPQYSTIIPDALITTAYNGTNNLNIDLTQWNHYQIGFNKGWIYVFVNGIMAIAYYDNNFYYTPSTGYWGFSTINTSLNFDYAFSLSETLSVKNITFPTFWNQNPVFILNPADDLTSSIMTNLKTSFGWMFSDLGGNLKTLVLKATDPVSYFYGNGATNYLLYSSAADSSNKEYFNEVLIVGDGVSALASDSSSIGTYGVLREEVIVDYTITTLAGAQARAQQELNNVRKYGAQPAPRTNINAGSEVFDVVNIQDNNGANSTNLNGSFRLFTQQFTIDNRNNYSITLGAGNVAQT